MPKPSAFRDWNAFMGAYGMAAVSNFKEGDSAPWQHYVGKGVTNWEKDAFKELVDTLKAVSEVMDGVQWGSNPYIETNMARGNCIGCHQGTTESFLPMATRELKSFNVSDFSFSFASNRASIRAIDQQNKAARKHRGAGK